MLCSHSLNKVVVALRRMREGRSDVTMKPILIQEFEKWRIEFKKNYVPTPIPDIKSGQSKPAVKDLVRRGFDDYGSIIYINRDLDEIGVKFFKGELEPLSEDDFTVYDHRGYRRQWILYD